LYICYEYNIKLDLFAGFICCRAASDWLYVVPWGLRRLIQWIKVHYGNPPIYITENGRSDVRSDLPDALNDQDRVDYYRTYINEVLKGSSLIIKI